jgi:hypothetical protein
MYRISNFDGHIETLRRERIARERTYATSFTKRCWWNFK